MPTDSIQHLTAPTLGEAGARPFQNALRVLLAEDNPINQKVALGQLRKLGLTADLAANGFAVLEALEKTTYDIVLMDCQMPEMDGYEAAMAIRQRESDRRHTWIVAMTANAMCGDRERCLAAGMDDYVSKPVHTSALAEAFSRARISSGEPPAIDRECIAELRGLPGEDDEDIFQRLVTMFQEDAPQTLAGIHTALSHGNGMAIARQAHTINGSAGYFGAARFQDLCREMESAGKTGNLDPLPDLLTAAERELQRVVAALKAELTLSPQ